jgi:hypothetical protein
LAEDVGALEESPRLGVVAGGVGLSCGAALVVEVLATAVAGVRLRRACRVVTMSVVVMAIAPWW